MEFTLFNESYYVNNMVYVAKYFKRAQGETTLDKYMANANRYIALGLTGVLASLMFYGIIGNIFKEPELITEIIIKRLIRVGMPSEIVYSIFSYFEMLFHGFIVLLIISSILFMILSVYHRIKGEVLFARWLGAHHIPVNFSKGMCMRTYGDEEEVEDIFYALSFEILKNTLKEDYERATNHYNKIIEEMRNTNQTYKEKELRFLFLMNYLASLEEGNKLLGNKQKSLVIQEIKKSI
nr:hypothetical protein [uncultured Niameybacter sp.]